MSDKEKTLLVTILLGVLGAVMSIILAVMLRHEERIDRLTNRIHEIASPHEQP